MATIPIQIPDALTADLRAAIERLYGTDVDGLTDTQKIAYHLRESLAPHVKATRRAADSAVIAARTRRETNNTARATAQAADEATVKNAEDLADAASRAVLGGIT